MSILDFVPSLRRRNIGASGETKPIQKIGRPIWSTPVAAALLEPIILDTAAKMYATIIPEQAKTYMDQAIQNLIIERKQYGEWTQRDEEGVDKVLNDYLTNLRWDYPWSSSNARLILEAKIPALKTNIRNAAHKGVAHQIMVDAVTILKQRRESLSTPAWTEADELLFTELLESFISVTPLWPEPAPTRTETVVKDSVPDNTTLDEPAEGGGGQTIYEIPNDHTTTMPIYEPIPTPPGQVLPPGQAKARWGRNIKIALGIVIIGAGGYALFKWWK